MYVKRLKRLFVAATIVLATGVGWLAMPSRAYALPICDGLAKTCQVQDCLILFIDKITQQTLRATACMGNVIYINGQCGLRWPAGLFGCPTQVGTGGGPRSSSACI